MIVIALPCLPILPFVWVRGSEKAVVLAMIFLPLLALSFLAVIACLAT
jgi:hypothetical protein